MPTASDLGFIRAEAPTQVDPQASSALEIETKSLENNRLREELHDLKQDRDQRKTYGSRLYWLVVCWLSIIGLIVLLHGFAWVQFTLSVAVLTTLIGSTTASVLGLFAIVANYLFPKR